MSTLEKFSFRARTTNGTLDLKVVLDGQPVWTGTVGTESVPISVEFDDKFDVEHILEITMSGKKPEDTVISESGEILQDKLIEIYEFDFTGIDLAYILSKTAVYEHDTNGTTEKKHFKFFGAMGCNGTVRFDFRSPVYLWLLETM